MAGRAEVLLEANIDGIGKVESEPADEGDVGAAPAVDRLVVVADDEHATPMRSERLQPGVLGEIDVLVFVRMDPVEFARPSRAVVGVIDQGEGRPEKKIAEVGRVGFPQARLIFGVHFRRRRQSGGVDRGMETVRFADPVFDMGGRALRRHQEVLESPDVPGHDLDRVALAAVVFIGGEVHRLHDAAENAAGVVGVEDVEIVAQRGDFGRGAQLAGREPMKRAEPVGSGVRTEGGADPARHFRRGLVGEGDGEDAMGRDAVDRDAVGDGCGQRRCLAGPAPASTRIDPG